MHSIAWWPTLIVLSLATVTDIRSRRIPNWLVLPFLVAGLVVSATCCGISGAVRSLAGVALASVVMGIPCWLHAMGMGDLKLCAALGAWIWPEQLFTALVVMGMSGGLMALIWAARSGSVGAALDGASDLVFGIWKRGVRPHHSLVLENPWALKMPYAPAIAVGTIFSFFAVKG